ncbi:hypothetical protein MJA45_27775 [Paenibacillus aurantius]|uniref:Uncharacterized protein n=1 Tax=Paenibacillus aurantius TaxID=2918900 RepID=A0AA96RFK5_9BACL|nr:hypothetical protein [Paenibacillus aurantius]WNQ11353.1 hypothetical protein MJA45_27775 [Paenibacillus aurantius]
MALRQYPAKTIEISKESGAKVNTAMTAIAWGVLAVGVLLCLMTISDFRDTNLGLMVGIGFLIASVQIFTIGTMIRWVHNRKVDEKE